MVLGLSRGAVSILQPLDTPSGLCQDDVSLPHQPPTDRQLRRQANYFANQLFFNQLSD